MPDVTPQPISPTGKPLLGNGTIAIVGGIVLALEALAASGLVPAQYLGLLHLVSTIGGIGLGVLSPGWRTAQRDLNAADASAAKATGVAAGEAAAAAVTTPAAGASVMDEMARGGGK